MSNKIILSTVVNEGMATNIWSSTVPRFRDSSPWIRVNLKDESSSIQVPINTVVDMMNDERFIIYQIGTNHHRKANQTNAPSQGNSDCFNLM